MPHVRIEHTDNIHTTDITGLFKSVQNILIKFADIKAENCKSRAIPLNNFHIESSNKKVGFVHLEINILEGRSEKIKNNIGEKSLKVLKSYFIDNMLGGSIQCSIEIREIKRSDYFTTNEI